MFEALTAFNGRLDRPALRVRRPKHTVFLCGGLIASPEGGRAALSVRDYLVRLRQIERRLSATIVLAETAQQLYRDTGYPDLITFEEDVARVSSIVLVISESAGSLAELGAFASEPVIKPALRILLSEEHERAESFVRFGPVKRIEQVNRAHIGVFPWRTHRGNGCVVKSSIAPHYREMVRFINRQISDIPDTYTYHAVPEKTLFFDIVWILSLLEAVPPAQLYDAIRIIYPDAIDSEIRNKLYVLKTIGWINSFSYSNQDYYYLPVNSDPYDYAFLEGQRVRDVAAAKLQISNEFRNEAGIARAVIRRLQEKRSEA